jgi:hypothetical protein
MQLAIGGDMAAEPLPETAMPSNCSLKNQFAYRSRYDF